MRRFEIALGMVLAVLPALGIGLNLSGILRIDGSHGLGAWLFLSLCFVIAALALTYNSVLLIVLLRQQKRSLALYALSSVIVSLGTILFFSARYGLPFSP